MADEPMLYRREESRPDGDLVRAALANEATRLKREAGGRKLAGDGLGARRARLRREAKRLDELSRMPGWDREK